MKSNVLTAVQTAKRLGVKVETIYAYVSRGLLGRTIASDGRTSLFQAAEVEQLARRGRPRLDAKRVGSVDVSLGTTITDIQATRACYRGYDLSELARGHSFEAVAELLWTGKLPTSAAWDELTQPPALVRRVSALLPRASPSIERFAAIAASLACAHPLRVDLGAGRVMQHGRLLIASFTHALSPLASDPSRKRARASVAQLLWPRLSPLPPTAPRVAVLNAALVLLADHELATSTFAARVAASTRADPFLAVVSGLGALSGPLHGKASIAVHRLLHDASLAESSELGAAQVISDSASAAAFGHPVYSGGDPRARALLAALAPLTKPRAQAMLEAVMEAGAGRIGAPNADFALGALAFALEMPLGSTEAVFAIARTAGFIAHVLEEYGEQPLRFRARAVYTG